jgi:hypothetical protein
VVQIVAIPRSAWQVFALRAAQGAIGAPQAPLIALASSILPVRYLSGGLGVLQTAVFLEE